jgi:hypothetical protein
MNLVAFSACYNKKQASNFPVMLSTLILPLLVASASLVAAIPPQVRPFFGEGATEELRLIKTSEADPGTWVTEEQKITDYVAKNIYFIDITDIKVSVFLAWEEVVNRVAY